MKITIHFSGKVTSPRRGMAIDIAKRNPYDFKDGYYSVYFKEPNKDLEELLDCTKGWSSTKVYIDDTEYLAWQVESVLFCRNSILCDGICQHISMLRVDEYNSFDALEIDPNDPKTGYTNRFGILSRLSRLGRLVEEVGNKEYKIKKDILKEYILTEYPVEFKYCNKISRDKIFEKIDKIPDKIIYKERWDETPTSTVEEFKEPEFQGLSDYEKKETEEKARIQAEIYAETFKKMLKDLLKK